MSIDNEKLIAFADGELVGAEKAAVEAALAADPELRAKLALHQSTRAKLSSAFEHAMSEEIPAQMRAALAHVPAEVVNLAERRSRRWGAREWGAMAASLAAGLVIAFGITGADAPMLASGPNGLQANGALEQALNTQLASAESGAVRIGLTFRAHDGDYCRTFDLTENATSGLACHDGGRWRIDMMAAHEGGGEVRTAGASGEILAAVDARIDGEALDADAERRARDAAWR